MSLIIAIDGPAAAGKGTLARAISEELVPGDLDRDDLRGEVVGQAASKVSAIPGVRNALLDFQRRFAEEPPTGVGAVLDGRDIGTVVCPDADLKLWLVADPTVRARRRHADAVAGGEAASFNAIAASIAERDAREATRSASPMHPAENAVIIDTSCLTRSEVLEMAMSALITRDRNRERDHSVSQVMAF